MPEANIADPKRPLCFVIGPIGRAGSEIRKAADWLLKHALRPVLEDAEFGYTVKRADDDADPGLITRGVLRDALTAELVVADLSGHNPNAFYELGVRHAASLPTIHVTTDGLEIPFDNKDQRTISFDFTDYDATEASKERLRAMVRVVREKDFMVSNPVTQARGDMELRASGDPRDQLIASLHDRLEAVEGQVRLRSTTPAPTTPALGSRMFGGGSTGDSDLLNLKGSLVEQAFRNSGAELVKASEMARFIKDNGLSVSATGLSEADLRLMREHADLRDKVLPKLP